MATRFAKVVPLERSGRLDPARVEVAFREALSAALTPDAHDLALALSLERAGLRELPSTHREIAIFLDGPFRTSVNQLCGESMARVVVGEARALTSFLGSSQTSGTRPRPEVIEQNVTARPPAVEASDRATIRVPHGLTPTPIIVLTHDRAMYEAVAREVGTRGDVLQAHNLTPFLTALHSDGLDPVLMVDGRTAEIRAKLSDCAARVPSSSHVVYWGDDQPLLEAMPDPRTRESWVAIELDAEVADVIAIVAVLAGAR
jgi:hypothetical protein